MRGIAKSAQSRSQQKKESMSAEAIKGLEKQPKPMPIAWSSIPSAVLIEQPVEESKKSIIQLVKFDDEEEEKHSETSSFPHS